jgi:hypothetical protein
VDTTIPVISLGAAAFWIALAAWLIAGQIQRTRREHQRHETLLRMIERTGKLDEEQIKLICPPPAPLPPHWFARPEPPDGRRALKIFGTIALSLAVGLAVFFAIWQEWGTEAQRADAVVGFAWAALIACLGVGLLIASRFVRPPLGSRERGEQ